MGNGPSAGSLTRILGVPVVVALLLTATGCAGDGAAAPTPRPASTTPSPTESDSEAGSPTPSPSPTTKPLSRFEDEPAVQAAREWAARTAQAINEQDRDMSSLASTATRHGRQVLPRLASEDFGLHYPGPIPFTPTGLEQASGTARVIGCFWVEGFALAEEGGVPAKPRLVIPAMLRMKRQDGGWKFDDFFDHQHSCKNIPVKGVGW